MYSEASHRVRPMVPGVRGQRSEVLSFLKGWGLGLGLGLGQVIGWEGGSEHSGRRKRV